MALAFALKGFDRMEDSLSVSQNSSKAIDDVSYNNQTGFSLQIVLLQVTCWHRNDILSLINRIALGVVMSSLTSTP